MSDTNTSGVSSHMMSCKKVMREQYEATFLAPWLQQLEESETSVTPVGNHDSRV